MGVPAFFRWLWRKHPKIMIDCIEPKDAADKKDLTGDNPNGVEFDNLYLDMNGIIHPCCHPEDKAAPATEADMFLAIFEYIDNLFAIVRPRRLLYLGIDGVAPRAKMNQQRSRRFRAAREMEQKKKELRAAALKKKEKGVFDYRDTEDDAWDSNVITPGTGFMHRLSLGLRKYVSERLASHPGWKNITVIFSDANAPGEGEHKIMEYIRRQRAELGYDPNMRHCLYGLDADLIMLGLSTHEPHFYLIREYVEIGGMTCRNCGKRGHRAGGCTEAPTKGKAKRGATDDEPAFQFLSIAILREYLFHELKVGKKNCPFDKERVLDDFIFLCFFVGNDFLPHLPSLSIRDGSLEFLLDVYRKYLPWGGYLTENGYINLERVLKIIEKIGAEEDKVFITRHERDMKQAQRKADHAARQKWWEENKHAKKNPKSKNAKGMPKHLLKPIKHPGGFRSGVVQTEDEHAPVPAVDPVESTTVAGGTDHGKVALAALPWNASSSGEGDAPPPPPAMKVALTPSQKKKKRKKQAKQAKLKAMLQPQADMPKKEDATSASKKGKKRKKRKAGGAFEQAEPPAKKQRVGENDGDWLPGCAPGLGLPAPPEEKKRPPLVAPAAPKDLGPKRKAALANGLMMDYAEGDSVRLWERGWKERYYDRKFQVPMSDKEFFTELRMAYVQGLAWVLQYYYQGVPSWRWYYPYHYAPFASDLVPLKTDGDDGSVYKIPAFSLGTPFSPLEQLLGVLPVASAHALPDAYADLMRDNGSILAGMYPIAFKIDMDGTKASWQGVVLLPFMDEVLLKKGVQAVKNTRNSEEVQRDSIRAETMYVIESSPILASIANKEGTTDLQPDKVGLGGRVWQVPSDSISQAGDGAVAMCYNNPGTADDKFVSCSLPGVVWPAPALTEKDFQRMSNKLGKDQRKGAGQKKSYIPQGKWEGPSS